MDIVSDILRDLRLESAVLSLGEFRAPWGIDKGDVPGAPFHIIIEGNCFVETADGVLIELAPGDLVMFPRGDRHALLSDPDADRTPFQEVLQANGVAGNWRPGLRIEKLDLLRFGGTGPVTRLVNGIFSFHDQRRNPLLEALPTMIHVRGQMARGPGWLEGSLSLLIDELNAGRPGFQTIVERLADMVFVQAVRDHIANAAANGSGWLGGLTDPSISRALSLIHDRPGQPWTVGSLASSVALSRSVFAHRFRTLVGSTVMDYVTARRMHVAAGMLTHSSDGLAEIASEVGYESEISFSKAFRRRIGVPPGQFRRRMRASASAPR